MKIKNQKLISGNVRAELKSTVIDILENMPSHEGVVGAKAQIALATKLSECSEVLDVSPEEATLIRSLINRATHLPPRIQDGMHEAFDPQPDNQPSNQTESQ